MRLTVRVHPGARTTSVGGRYGTSDPPVLTVKVSAPADGGKANQAVIDALSAALGVGKKDITLILGRTGRTKILEIRGASPETLAALLGS